MILSLITYPLSLKIKPILQVYTNVSKLPPLGNILLILATGKCCKTANYLLKISSRNTKVKHTSYYFGILSSNILARKYTEVYGEREILFEVRQTFIVIV